MIEHIPALIEAGIHSFKIEGRMKSAYYVGCVVGAYRKAIDAYYADPAHYVLDDALVQELYDSATRRFTTGFYFGNPAGEGQDILRAPVPRRFGFCGAVQAPARKMAWCLWNSAINLAWGIRWISSRPICRPASLWWRKF